MEEKKRIKVQYYMYNTIVKDMEAFQIKKNTICNKIFTELADETEDYIEEKRNFDRELAFNLNNENKIKYDSFVTGKNRSESELFREIFSKYCNMPAYKRERIIFRENIEKIREGIQKKKKLIIEYGKNRRTVTPFFIEKGNEEEFNYLFCFSDESNDYRNYRISKIKKIVLINEDVVIGDREYIEGVRKNFDPFLSYGKKIKVKMSKTAIKRHEETMVHNKPKTLEKGEIWEFECSEEKAIVYFSGFLGQVEIIEPEVVRNRYIELCKKAIGIHEGSHDMD